MNGATNAACNHVYTFTPSSIESGLNFPVTASDRAGNVVTATFDVERDDTAPAVTVNVAGRIFSSTIPVSWTVNELGAGATGVYTVSVITDTGPLQLWLSSVTSTSADFSGELGHRYTFVVTTTDNVSNVGQGTAEAIATQVTKYYYVGSSHVAMRRGTSTGTEVTYLHTDHLGTVSIATSASQMVAARTLNLPYGGVRWTSGEMPTDYAFTGQKDTGLGLVYMHARFYSEIGRWISPDTIVPNPVSPQDLNRYSYARSNPLKYVDPSGHFLQCYEIPTMGQHCKDDGFSISNPPFTSDDPDVRGRWLYNYALALAGWARQGFISNLDALVELSNATVSLIPTDAPNRVQAYVNDMSWVLIGAEGQDVLLTSFFPAHTPPEFGDSGFHPDYRDEQNQLYHFWAYVTTVANRNDSAGYVFGYVGNIFHEFFDPLEGFRTLLDAEGKSGTSWQDYHLAKQGMAMGAALANGTLPIEQAGNYMRLALGKEFTGAADDQQRAQGTSWWPSKLWERFLVTIFGP